MLATRSRARPKTACKAERMEEKMPERISKKEEIRFWLWMVVYVSFFSLRWDMFGESEWDWFFRRGRGRGRTVGR